MHINAKKAARFLLPPSGSRNHRSGKPKSLRCSFQSSGMFFIICAMETHRVLLRSRLLQQCQYKLENKLLGFDDILSLRHNKTPRMSVNMLNPIQGERRTNLS